MFVNFVSFCSRFPRVCGIFFIDDLSSCTFTSLYLICSPGCKQNSYDFLGLTTRLRARLRRGRRMDTKVEEEENHGYHGYHGYHGRSENDEIRMPNDEARMTNLRKSAQSADNQSLCSPCPLRSTHGAAKPISIGALGCCVFTITALSGCTSTSFYLISSMGFRENSWSFLTSNSRRPPHV